jgi:hypothetical protein
MLIAYGFPKVLCAGRGLAEGEGENWFYIRHDLTYIVAVSSSVVQVWSAGLHRCRLSQVARSEKEISEEGFNFCAYWCPTKATLAVLVSLFILSATEGVWCHDG